MYLEQEEAYYFHTLAQFNDVILGLGVDQVLNDLQKHFPDSWEKLWEAMERQKTAKEKLCKLVRG